MNQESNRNPTLIIRLRNIIGHLLRLWWIILIIAVIAGLAGIWYASIQQIEYKSRLTFALDDGSGSGIGSFLNLASEFGISIGSGKNIFEGDNIVEIIKSRRVIEEVLTSVDTFEGKPYTLLEFFLNKSEKSQRKRGANEKEVHFPVGLHPKDYSLNQDSVLYNYYELFKKELIIAHRPDKKLSIYEINVTTPNEKLSKVFTEKLLDATNRFYTKVRTEKARRTLDILEDRVAKMKTSLNESISNKATVQDVNINPVFQKAEIPVLKQQANIRVFSGAYAELYKNLEIARFQYLNKIPLIQVIDAAKYPMEEEVLGKLTAIVLFIFLAEVIFFLVLGLKMVFWD